MNRFCLSLIAVSVLTGCAGSLTVNSTPQGALISSNQQSLGLAPYVITLDDTAAQRFPQNASGCYIAPGFTAEWASGAQAASPETTPLCQGLSHDYSVTIGRPSGAPGLDKDLAAANARESVLAKQAQAQATNNVANAIEMNAVMSGPGMGYGPYGW